MTDCSLRVYRQILPSCIPENEPLVFGNDEFDDHEDGNTSKFLFSSPKKHLPNISQTIKQQPRIYPRTVSRLLASSPAHQNQYRLNREIGQTVTSTATMTTISSSGSPCLSPIRYSLDTSQINENQSINSIPMPTEDMQLNQNSFPTDDSSLKVSVNIQQNDMRLIYFSSQFVVLKIIQTVEYQLI